VPDRSAGTRFMAAFNDIEDHFRTSLHKDEHVEFGQLMRSFADRNHLTWAQRDALSAFGLLRNAISHSRYYDGMPIAEPVEEVVTQIERLRDQLKNPPNAFAVLGPRNVCSVEPNEPISTALEYVRRFDYSQLPIYQEGTYAGLLTTNAIARWLANQLAVSGGLAESEAVSVVLAFAEPHERALHVPRTITITDALYQLEHGGEAEEPVTALIITQNGKTTEQPLSLVVADDLPALFEAVKM